MSLRTSRRNFLKGSVATAAAGALLGNPSASGATSSPSSPILLGVASYSFRKFGRDDVIRFMKQLDTPYLNVKDVHLPMTTPEQIRQAADAYAAAGIKLTAAGAIYFTEDNDDDMRRKFEYCKIAG